MRSRLLTIAALIAGAATLRAATVIDVSTSVITPSVKRLGINLGWMNNYDSGQIMKNLIFRNPGFEGQIYRSIIRCVSGSATGCVDENATARWPAGFWNGASYEVIWGAAKGRTGTVTSSTAPSGSTGSTYLFADAGTPPGAGDYIVLRKSDNSGATAGWQPSMSGGATITDEAADLPPATLGHLAVRMTSLVAGQSARLSAVFDSSVAGPFVQLNGTFRLTFKAKGVGGTNNLGIFIGRGAPTNATYVNQTIALTNAWNTYNIDFTAAESGAAGAVQVSFAPVNLSAVLLDDVSLQQTNGDPTNTTAFRDPVVNALKSFNPGILRYWVEDLGDSLDNEIVPPFGRMRSAYSSQSTVREDVMYGFHEFLELCELVHAEPWFIVPTTFSSQDMTHLIEYLGGPPGSGYGAIRAVRGHVAPWTASFARIHLEFGNEAWNNLDYYGGTISDPVSYAGRGSDIFAVARTSPYYSTAIFDLVLGGQASFPGRNVAINNAGTNHDTIAVAPYFGGNTDAFGTDEDLYGPLFAEPEMLEQTGYMRQNFNNMRAAARPVPLAIYEVNLHTTNPSACPQATLDSFTPSVGAGIAVADHMLMMMRDLGIRDQILYSLTQFSNGRSDGKHVLLWGSVRDMGVTDRKRPQFLAVKLANEVIAGDLVQTTQSGDNPTWNQPLVNGIQYPAAHDLQSYAFANGNSRAIIVFNLHRTSPLQVTFTGGGAPSGAVTLRQLTAGALTATNENAENVAITTQTIASFDPSQPWTLPPFSMSVFESSAVPSRLKGDVSGSGVVSAFDAALILQAVVGSITLDPTQQCAADYNSDGIVSAYDASLVLQCVVGGACSTARCN